MIPAPVGMFVVPALYQALPPHTRHSRLIPVIPASYPSFPPHTRHSRLIPVIQASYPSFPGLIPVIRGLHQSSPRKRGPICCRTYPMIQLRVKDDNMGSRFRGNDELGRPSGNDELGRPSGNDELGRPSGNDELGRLCRFLGDQRDSQRTH